MPSSNSEKTKKQNINPTTEQPNRIDGSFKLCFGSFPSDTYDFGVNMDVLYETKLNSLIKNVVFILINITIWYSLISLASGVSLINVIMSPTNVILGHSTNVSNWVVYISSVILLLLFIYLILNVLFIWIAQKKDALITPYPTRSFKPQFIIKLYLKKLVIPISIITIIGFLLGASPQYIAKISLIIVLNVVIIPIMIITKSLPQIPIFVWFGIIFLIISRWIWFYKVNYKQKTFAYTVNIPEDSNVKIFVDNLLKESQILPEIPEKININAKGPVEQLSWKYHFASFDGIPMNSDSENLDGYAAKNEDTIQTITKTSGQLEKCPTNGGEIATTTEDKHPTPDSSFKNYIEVKNEQTDSNKDYEKPEITLEFVYKDEDNVNLY